MKKLFKWIKNYFRPPKYDECDIILKNLTSSLFFGNIGDTIFYPDSITHLPIITIQLTKNDIKFKFDPNKYEFCKNIGIFEFNKLERIYLYSKIETYMIEEGSRYIEEIKQTILSKYGLVESDFVFLMKNCKEK